MKKYYLFATVVLVILFATISSAGQEPLAPDTSLDQQIKLAEEKLAKLKRLKELQDQIKALQTETGTTTPPLDRTPAVENERSETETQPVGPNVTTTGPTAPDAAGSGTVSSTAAGASSSGRLPSFNDCSKFIEKQSSKTKHDLEICYLAQALVGHREKGDALAYNPRTDSQLLASVLSSRVRAKNVTDELTIDSQAIRTDKQIGSDTHASGTTSLVAKGGIPLIMSLAVENGAAVSSLNGTTLSFRFNPIGLWEKLTNGSTDNFNINDSVTNHLRRMAFGVSYDISRGVPNPMFTGSRDQFAGASFRYEFTNHRNPTDEAVRNYTRDFMRKHALAFDQAARDLIVNYLTPPRGKELPPVVKAVVDKFNDTMSGLNAEYTAKASDDDKAQVVFDAIRSYLDATDFDDLRKDTRAFTAFNEYGAALDRYQSALLDIRNHLTRRSLFTFDYNYDRSFTASNTSTGRLIFEKGWDNGADFTFNAGATMFHGANVRVPVINRPSLTSAQKRFKDFSFAAQLDMPLTGLGGALRESTFTVAGRYQRMTSGTVILLDGTPIDNISGDIWLGQAKLLLPLGKTGLFFPISFTYANRTELIKEKRSRGNFGFTFDLSSLLQKYLGGSL